MTDGTYLSTGITTLPDTIYPFSYNIFSHRTLFQNKYSSTWGFGLGSNLDFHFFMFSLSSIPRHNSHQHPIPKINLKFSLGADTYPLRLSVQQELQQLWTQNYFYYPFSWIMSQTSTTCPRNKDNKKKNYDYDSKSSFQAYKKNQRGELSLGLSPTGDVELRLTSTHTLSRFCNLTMGLQHVSNKGFTWFIKVSRGETSFTLPILLTLTSSTQYWIKSAYVSLCTVLLDMSIQELIYTYKDSDSLVTYDSYIKATKSSIKNKDQALKEQQLMAKVAASKREESDLVILKATYEVRNGDSWDVTTALQYWVINSRIRLNSGSKKSLLGFYDLTPNTRKDMNETNFLHRCLSYLGFSAVLRKVYDGPYLVIRYKAGGEVFELVIEDECALELPDPLALKLGGSNVS